MQKLVLYLTILRLLLSPIILISGLFFELYFFAFLLFISASATDYLDGMMARKYNVETKLGAILDPIADKVLILFSLITIVLAMNDPYIALMSSIILSREFLISAMREYLAKDSPASSISVTYLAKIKTTIQFFAVSMFFYGLGVSNALILFLASLVLFLATILTLKTGFDYILKFLAISKSAS